MRKLTVALLITVLGASCFSAFLSQTYAQESTEPTPAPLPPPPIMRWTRFRGAVTQWGDDPYNGSVTVNTKVPIYPPQTGVDPLQTTNMPPPRFRPWATVEVFWSNERPPITKLGIPSVTRFFILGSPENGSAAEKNVDSFNLGNLLRIPPAPIVLA